MQAIAGAEAGAFLISPFVGRILDWYKANHKREYSAQEDPGVKSVQTIYNYYKKHGYKTIVMGASFRNTGEITELAGCDYLTISVSFCLFSIVITLLLCPANKLLQPGLLEQLYNGKEAVPKKLDPSLVAGQDIPKRSYLSNESAFRFDLNEDAMAVDKLREGISKFAKDAVTLKDILRKKLQA